MDFTAKFTLFTARSIFLRCVAVIFMVDTALLTMPSSFAELEFTVSIRESRSLSVASPKILAVKVPIKLDLFTLPGLGDLYP